MSFYLSSWPPRYLIACNPLVACILESKLKDVNKFCQCAYLNGSFRSEIRDSGTPAVSGAGEMAAHGEVVNENYEVSEAT